MADGRLEGNLLRDPDFHSVKDRLHIVKVGEVDMLEKHGADSVAMVFAAMEKQWIRLLSLLCAESQEWPHPTTLILDQNISPDTIGPARAIIGSKCKVFLHWAGCASRLHGYTAPFKESGFSDWEDVVDLMFNDETLRMGRSRDGIIEAVFRVKNGSDTFNGTVLRIPGIPPMYDYEREFGELPVPANTLRALRGVTVLSKQVDGVVLASSKSLEGAAIMECSKYVRLYPVGVQVSPRAWISTGLSLDDGNMVNFLQKFGENEVLLISFGSMFFPQNTQNLKAMMDALLESRFPFILAMGGFMASMSKGLGPEEFARMEHSGIGLIHKGWCDQQALLQHPAIGWLLFHGGFNSLVESLVQGVPMIGWPLAFSDQALNVAMGSMRDKPFAFELLQIRTGPAKAMPMRGGVEITGSYEDLKREFLDIFAKARGHEGQSLRKNANDLSRELMAERDSSDAYQEFAFM